MTVVIGVDPSLTCTGVAMLAWDAAEPRFAHWQTWRARSQALPKDFPEAEIVPATRRRLRIVLRESLALIPGRVDLTVIEGPSRKSKQSGMSDERAALRWWLIDQLLARGPVVVLTPKTRALLGCDNGNAEKRVVREAVRAAYPDVHIPDDNVADAVALAAAGAHRLGFPVEYSPKQTRAHARIAWPTELAVA